MTERAKTHFRIDGSGLTNEFLLRGDLMGMRPFE